MKKLTLVTVIVFFITSSFKTFGAESESKSSSSKSYRLKVASGYSISDFETPPFNVKKDELTPPILTLGLGATWDKSIGQLNMDTSLAFVEFFDPVVSFELSLLFNFSFLKFGGGAEVILASFGDDNKFKDTHFDNAYYGYYLNVLFDLYIFEIYGEFRQRELFDSVLTKLEGIETQIGHSGDTFLKLGAKTSLLGISAMAEITNINLGITSIVSKEFSYKIKSDNVVRATLGGGIGIGSLELWLKYQRMLDIEDEISYLYQATYISPDYIMSKDTVFAELIWNF